MENDGTSNLTIIQHGHAAEMLARERGAEAIDPLCKVHFVGLGSLKRVSDLETLKAFTVLA